MPANSSRSISAELQHIEAWSSSNNLKLNRSKSFELIFHLPRSRLNRMSIPPAPDSIIRVDELKCLGITICSDFSVTKHIANSIASCSQSLYALRTLRAHGMCDELLQSVFKSSTLSKLLYASPVWWGFTNAADRDRLETFIRKASRARFYNSDKTFASLCESADLKLFKSVTCDPHHVLYPSLPPKVTHSHNLRHRPHNYYLPKKRHALDECNFICRMQYKDCY